MFLSDVLRYTNSVYCAMLRTARLCRSMSSVCLSVRPSVTFRYRDHIGWNTSKIISRLKVYARADPNTSDLVQREHPQNWGGIWVRSWAQYPAISLKLQDSLGPRLLWRTNSKSHTRFRLVPESMTLDDLERPERTLAEKDRFTELTRKTWMKTDPNCQRQNVVNNSSF